MLVDTTNAGVVSSTKNGLVGIKGMSSSGGGGNLKEENDHGHGSPKKEERGYGSGWAVGKSRLQMLSPKTKSKMKAVGRGLQHA